MIAFLVSADTTAVDTARTYEIPEVLNPRHDMLVSDEIAPGYFDREVTDMLSYLPLVPVSYGLGRFGAGAGKGRKPYYTRIYLNGRPLHHHPFGHFNLGFLPLHFVDRISVGQIAAGAQMSGVNFVSRVNRYDRPYSRAEFALGSYQSSTYGFDLTRALTNDLGFYLSGSYQETDGHRENSAAQALSLYSNVYVNRPLRLRFDFFYVGLDYGFPGSTILPVTGQERDQFIDVSATAGIDRGAFTLFYDHELLDYRDTLHDKSLQVEVDCFGMLFERHDTLFSTALDYGASGAVINLNGGAYLPTGLHRLDVWTRLNKSVGRAFMRVSGRMESANYHEIFLCPKIEVGVSLPGSARLSAALSRDARPPSDFERWASYDSLVPYLSVAGDRFLSTEYCWIEEFALRGNSFLVNLYRVRFSDHIGVARILTNDYDYVYTYVNQPELETSGIEGHLTLPLRWHNSDRSAVTEFVFGLGGNVQLSGDTITYYPHSSASTVAAVRRDTRRFGWGFALRAQRGAERLDLAGEEYSGYNVISAAGLIRFMSLSCVARLNNVLDEEYAYLPFFPMAARSFDISVRWEFWD